MDPLKIANLAYAITIILNCTCAAMFFHFNPIKKEKNLAITIKYFLMLYLATAAAYLVFLGEIWSNKTLSIFLSNLLFMIGFYSIRYAFLWRTGYKKHLYQNPLVLIHTVIFVFIQVYILHIVYDILNYRIIFALVNYIIILASCINIIPKQKKQKSYGEKVAISAIIIAISLLLIALIIHVFTFNIFIYQTALMIAQGLIALCFLGAFQTLLLSDVSNLHYENSITDPLTGLYNRRYFMQQASSALKTARRHEFPISLIMCDIDYFKKINDKFGHDSGDKALQSFSNLLTNRVRDGDTLSRYGGEEFAILLPQTSLDGALVLAERMRHETEQMSIKTPTDTIKFTASFGVTSISAPADFEMSLKIVDDAMYKAKKLGRNRVQQSE
jgi:diguanylate cyclase (GGDEF)-like protein